MVLLLLSKSGANESERHNRLASVQTRQFFTGYDHNRRSCLLLRGYPTFFKKKTPQAGSWN